MPQLIGRGETDTSSPDFPVPADRLLRATLCVVRSTPTLVLDSLSRPERLVMFSTKVGPFGWGEVVSARAVGTGESSSRLEVSVQGRYRAQFLQPQRNARLVARLTRAVRAEVLRQHLRHRSARQETPAHRRRVPPCPRTP